ncbi:MAG: hypothetical protein HUU17_14090 [Chthonomonadales bacterium]|nr:hypothetical protein [Chthonomonadales bacterium]
MDRISSQRDGYSTTSTSRSDTAGLRRFIERLGDRFLRGVVLNTGTEIGPIAANIHALPVSTL